MLYADPHQSSSDIAGIFYRCAAFIENHVGREAAKKFLPCGPTNKRGRGVKAGQLRKITFFDAIKKLKKYELYKVLV